MQSIRTPPTLFLPTTALEKRRQVDATFLKVGQKLRFAPTRNGSKEILDPLNENPAPRNPFHFNVVEGRRVYQAVSSGHVQ